MGVWVFGCRHAPGACCPLRWCVRPQSVAALVAAAHTTGARSRSGTWRWTRARSTRWQTRASTTWPTWASGASRLPPTRRCGRCASRPRRATARSWPSWRCARVRAWVLVGWGGAGAGAEETGRRQQRGVWHAHTVAAACPPCRPSQRARNAGRRVPKHVWLWARLHQGRQGAGRLWRRDVQRGSGRGRRAHGGACVYCGGVGSDRCWRQRRVQSQPLQQQLCAPGHVLKHTSQHTHAHTLTNDRRTRAPRRRCRASCAKRW
jgi:hypothetical protein